MLHAEGLKGFLLFLIAAGIFIPLFHRARIGAVLGFLLVGLAFGPHGLGQFAGAHPWIQYITFDHPERAEALAELGVIFLLFLLGLELSIERLWQLRRYVFGVGLLQVGVSVVAIGTVVRFFGLPPPSGVILGMCFALSSTAIVMQILTHQHRAATPVGRIALSVLLFQDLMVVPILVVLGVLSGGREGAVEALAIAFGQAIVAVGGIMVIGRFVVRPLLHSAAGTGSREIMMAITLLIVIGLSTITGMSGLSMVLGAFLAGLLLSETEFKHQIEVDFDPFKGLLLGIFFVYVGANIDLRVVAAHALWILAAVLGLMAAKTVILYVAARLFRCSRAHAIEVAILLSQAGEFAFVVLGLARNQNLISPSLASAGIAVAGLSMLATPVLALLARKAAERMEPEDHAGDAPEPEAKGLDHHVVICGFGRVGQTVARTLEAENVPYVAFDLNGELVSEHRAAGRRVYFGDGSRVEILKLAGARRARAFVVTLDGRDAAEHAVRSIRSLRKRARILARARDPLHAKRLSELGAAGPVPETIEASLILAARLLQVLDLPEEHISKRIAAVRTEFVAANEDAVEPIELNAADPDDIDEADEAPSAARG
ncbi:MAG: cation:proton antiporter [Pseudorhodoplanes sp.]